MQSKTSHINNTLLINLPFIQEEGRGDLCFAEINKHIPFKVKRFFFILNTPKGACRAQHANKFTEQVLLCVKGKVEVKIDDGINRDSIVLSKPNLGLFLGSMLWRSIVFSEEGTILLVVCSEHYKKEDYISNYQEFKNKILTK